MISAFTLGTTPSLTWIALEFIQFVVGGSMTLSSASPRSPRLRVMLCFVQFYQPANGTRLFNVSALDCVVSE